MSATITYDITCDRCKIAQPSVRYQYFAGTIPPFPAHIHRIGALLVCQSCLNDTVAAIQAVPKTTPLKAQP